MCAMRAEIIQGHCPLKECVCFVHFPKVKRPFLFIIVLCIWCRITLPGTCEVSQINSDEVAIFSQPPTLLYLLYLCLRGQTGLKESDDRVEFYAWCVNTINSM